MLRRIVCNVLHQAIADGRDETPGVGCCSQLLSIRKSQELLQGSDYVVTGLLVLARDIILVRADHDESLPHLLFAVRPALVHALADESHFSTPLNLEAFRRCRNERGLAINGPQDDEDVSEEAAVLVDREEDTDAGLGSVGTDVLVLLIRLVAGWIVGEGSAATFRYQAKCPQGGHYGGVATMLKLYEPMIRLKYLGGFRLSPCCFVPGVCWEASFGLLALVKLVTRFALTKSYRHIDGML